MQDTLWLLYISEITRELVCYTDADGWLQGAIIDGKNYGSLYPVSAENRNKSPTDFSLAQNYPNPFNPTTKIKYIIPSVRTSLMKSLHVILRIYDILGSEIVTLVNEEQTAGEYEFELDGTELPNGICFYKLTAGNLVETKKMVLLK